jgi:SpoVK/Ycf46/Vps4 family AAA+-type ATPase
MKSRRIEPTTERLIRLFRSHRDGNSAAFRTVAESIITEELAANRHAEARELKNALGTSTESFSNYGMHSIPRTKNSGESLLSWFLEPASTDHLLLDSHAQKQLDRVIDERRHASRLAKHGYSPKSKLLFWGPPGCGKTLTAHHLANQLNLPLGIVRLSVVITSLLGETSSRIQQIFDAAQQTPMVLLIDEFDSVAKTRYDENDVGEVKRVVNALLQSIDGFVSKQSLIIGASNHQTMLDDAVWRRFDDVIEFPKPASSMRTQFITHMLNGVRFAGSISELTKATQGSSFAEIERVLVESLKTMILSDRSELLKSDVTEQLQHLKRTIAIRKPK